MHNNKLLIIVGPTGIGKTSLAVKVAKLFNGELISADSRQVYKEMDIITGKDLPVNIKYQISNIKINNKNINYYFFDSIRIWGLDLVEPDNDFTVSHWLIYTKKIIRDLWQKKKLPIIVGGTGFWIKALLEGIETMGISPNYQLRQQLNNSTIEQLQQRLEKIWPERLERMNRSDINNPRRLIRAIEIGQRIKNYELRIMNKNLKFRIKNTLIIGLKTNYKTLYQKIDQRVRDRMKKGAEKEIEKLIKKGYSWNLPSMTALGYKEWRPYFEQKINLNKVVKHWQFAEHKYARRQMTWFKKMKNIYWLEIDKKNWQNKVVKLIKSWYDGNNGKNRNFL